MPVELPNSKCFRPIYPKSKDNHVLFGPKYHKVHQFNDKRWPPTAPIVQYKYMVKVLSKNLTFKTLERNVNNVKEKKNLVSLRNQCRDGRIILRGAKQGNLTRITNILINHRELRRMYQRLPSHLIIENINQRTFLKRKENDRLKHKLKVLTETYANKLLEQSKLEDRIKYQNEFLLQDELNVRTVRKDLANSVTRMRAFKLINRAYEKIVERLKRDDIYLESVLNSLEEDILEQANFIQQVILLGIPAMCKFKILAAEYKQSEDTFREQLRSNLLYITQFKKHVKDEEDQVKNVVRKNCDSIGIKRNYVRETSSLLQLRVDVEEMAKTVRLIKNETYSSMNTDILPEMEKKSLQNLKMAKDLVREDEHKFRLEDQEMRAEAMLTSLINNSSESENEQLQAIKVLKYAIKNEKVNQKAADDYIIKNGIIFNAFRVSLSNIAQILRHVGNNLPHIKQQYPNEELKLPFLNFTHESRLVIPPPIHRNYDMEKLMEVARDKTSLLMEDYQKHSGGREKYKNYNYLYTKTYVDSLKPVDMTFTDTRKTIEEFLTEKADVTVPTRDQIKMRSNKILGDHKMRQEFDI